MATLVRAQGEMLDNVQQNLGETENYLERAEVNLEKADTIGKTNQKAMCCVICCLSFVALLFVILISGVIPF